MRQRVQAPSVGCYCKVNQHTQQSVEQRGAQCSVHRLTCIQKASPRASVDSTPSPSPRFRLAVDLQVSVRPTISSRPSFRILVQPPPAPAYGCDRNSMAPFDPIRDSAASSNPAASPTMPRTNSSSSFGADEDGNEEGHYRRPSRSASIMSILNPTPSSPVGGERPSSSASRHASPPLRPSRMSIHGLVTPSSPHGQPTPPPAAQHTSSRSPSLPIANVLNPSPMIRGSARPSFSSTSQHLYEGGPPSSSSSSSSEYFHPRPLPLQVDPRSPPVPGLMPQFASRWATSPTEAVPPPPPQQYYESPTGGSVVPLPPHHHAAAYPMYDQHPRGRDGFRVPSLPSHRSPDLVKATLPPLTPGGSASNYHQPYAYSPASTPGGYGSVPPPNEFYPPTTPGAGGSGSNYGGPISAHPPPLTPGVPLTPGGSGEPREGYYAWPPVRRDGPEEVAARERTSSYTSAQGWVGGKPVSADDVRQEEAEDAAPKSAEKPPAKKKAKRPSASSSSSKGPAEKADHGEDLKATKTASPTTAQRRTSKPKIDAVFPGTVIPAAEVSAGSEIASSGLPSASSMPSPSPSSATPSTSTSASATTVPRKVKALDLEEMEQLANRDGPMGKKRKSSTANAATDTVEAKSGATEAAGVEATTAKKPRLPLPPRPATAGAGEDDEMQDREPSPSAANGVAATIKQEPSASASSPLPVSTSSSIAPPAPLLSSSPSSSTTIAYQPTRRVSRADGVMRPISRDQLIHLHEVIQMRGSNKLREVWRREQREMGRDDRDGFWEILVPGWGSASSVGHKTGSDGNSNGAAVTRGHRNGAVTPAGSIKYENAPDEVARHYNNRQEVGMQARDQSPILALKNFNNW